jgi:hypothetical protein
MSLFLMLPLSGCSGWTVQPLPYTPPTPFSSATPSIYTPTPIILPPPVTSTLFPSSPTSTLSIVTMTSSIEPTYTNTPPIGTIPPTIETAPSARIKVEILGCNTSFDFTHGMGEVTNAYATISNLGSTSLENICATLSSLNEGRAHPDKTKCLPSLPAGFQVTEKLTVANRVKKTNPIQIDVTSNNVLLERAGKDSCNQPGFFPPDIDNLGVVQHIP